MKYLTGFIGAALAVLVVAWFVMLLAGDIYPISYKETLHGLSIVYVVTALLRKAD
jgi:hypothetical protein